VIIEVHPEHPQPRRIRQAVDLLRDGQLIAYPTDTVYAIGCSVEDKRAVELIHRVKAEKNPVAVPRGEKNQPLSIIVPDLSTIAEWAVVEDWAYRLLRRATPGAFTFILEASRRVPRVMLTRQKTIGIRVPDSPVALALCAELGGPVITTSATGEDGELLLDPREIEASYKGRIAAVLDAGALLPQPSTVIDLTGDEPRVLREGKGSLDAIGLADAARE
jgi:tRNA threonylcarbamoyl adenosine modification protein (Sua5/YciO/YrdC/YwlC family)